MDNFYTTVSRAAPWPPPNRRHRAARIGAVKFVGLPDEAVSETLGPVPRSDPPVAGTRAGARLLAFLRRIAFRVIGRPSAARP
jgi:hypothetical protein